MPIHREWVIAGRAPAAASLPVRSAAVASLFAKRGVADAESFRRFVSPTPDDLHDPSTIHGMDVACERIARAIANREQILIYGDYDVDGVTSIVLLKTVLRALGARVGFVVPHRLVDGYGLKLEVIDRYLGEQNVKLVITVDCGISSIEPVARAIERGIDVIITDHHLPPGTIPEAAAILNPHQDGCTYPFKDLAGVGVAFKLCYELLRRRGHRMSIESLIKIAAIGTIADVAPLIGENRTIARIGLEGLADSRNPGLRALLRNLGLAGRPLRATDVGFKIGPRINAAGRLASADTAIRLFEAASEQDALPLVDELNRLNRERQAIEAWMIAEAESLVAESGDVRILVLAAEKWHRGVVGLCAGKIAQRHHKPALMIAIDGDLCVGSGRSIPGVNLHGALSKHADLFAHFGGHEYACGFTFERRRLDEVRERLADEFAELDGDLYVRRARVDAEVSLDDVTGEFFREIEMLEPFGAGNVRPLFASREVSIVSSRMFSADCHSLLVRSGGTTHSAVVWPSTKQLVPLLAPGSTVDLLFHLDHDRYAPAGFRLEIVDCGNSGEAVFRNE